MVSPSHMSFCKTFIKFGQTVEAEQRSTGIGLETFSFESHQSSNLKLIYNIIILTRFYVLFSTWNLDRVYILTIIFNAFTHKLFFLIRGLSMEIFSKSDQKRKNKTPILNNCWYSIHERLV